MAMLCIIGVVTLFMKVLLQTKTRCLEEVECLGLGKSINNEEHCIHYTNTVK